MVDDWSLIRLNDLATSTRVGMVSMGLDAWLSPLAAAGYAEKINGGYKITAQGLALLATPEARERLRVA